MLRYKNFKSAETMQLRELWPSRVEGKVVSLQSRGWLLGDCVHAIADEGVTVSDHKLDNDKDACAGVFDGCHRMKAVGILEQLESGLYFEIPTMLYRHDTPKHLWFKDAFARLEVNQSCNAYSTIDLIVLVGATLSEYACRFTKKNSLALKAAVVFEAWYGAPPTDGILRVTALDIHQITNVLECHAVLVESGQLDFVVKELGARDHQIAAKCCHQLLDSDFIEGGLTGEFEEGECTGKFKEGACFLALPGRSHRRFLPFGRGNKGIFRATQRGETVPTLLKEVFLCVYGSWVMSWGAKHATAAEWRRVSERIKRRGTVPGDLDKLYEVHKAAPMTYDLFTLELLAAQPGLLKKAAMKLQWAALLAKDLTESGSRNSVVVVVVVVVGDLIS
jgi:hypothetical protein